MYCYPHPCVNLNQTAFTWWKLRNKLHALSSHWICLDSVYYSFSLSDPNSVFPGLPRPDNGWSLLLHRVDEGCVPTQSPLIYNEPLINTLSLLFMTGTPAGQNQPALSFRPLPPMPGTTLSYTSRSILSLKCCVFRWDLEKRQWRNNEWGNAKDTRASNVFQIFF